MSVTEETRATYCKVYVKFNEFGENIDARPLGQKIEAYAVWRREQHNICYDTIVNDVCAIGFCLAQEDVQMPRRSPLFRQALKGWKKSGGGQKHSVPLQADNLCYFMKLLSQRKKHDRRMLRAALTYAFMAMNRCSEYAARSLTSERRLLREQLEFVDVSGTALAKVTHSVTKTSRGKEKNEQSLLFCTCKLDMCALCSLRKYVHTRDRKFGMRKPLFLWSTGRPLVRSDVTRLMDMLSERMQLPERVTTHSLRSGGATFYFMLGLPFGTIAWLGRWSLQSTALAKCCIQPQRVRMVQQLAGFFGGLNSSVLGTLDAFGRALRAVG